MSLGDLVVAIAERNRAEVGSPEARQKLVALEVLWFLVRTGNLRAARALALCEE